MNYNQWIGEVQRVAKTLGLDHGQTLELTQWTIRMAHDHLDEAQAYFTGELEVPVLDQAFNTLDERLWEAFGDLADQVEAEVQ